MKNLRNALVLVAGFKGIASHAEVSVDTLTPELYHSYGYPGSGYDSEKKISIGGAQCMVGDTETEVVRVSAPGFKQIVLTHEQDESVESDEIRVKYVAVSSWRKVERLKGPLKETKSVNMKAACGDSYIVEKSEAGGFAIHFDFRVQGDRKPEDMRYFFERMVGNPYSLAYLIWKQKYHADERIAFSGAGYEAALSDNATIRTPLLNVSETCNAWNLNCDKLVYAAYDLKRALDDIYSEDRTKKFGQPEPDDNYIQNHTTVEYIVQSYK